MKKITVNNISFELTGEQYHIKDRGTVLTAQLDTDQKYTWDSVGEGLRNQVFDNKRIIGVEMFAIDSQTGKPIGLLIEDL